MASTHLPLFKRDFLADEQEKLLDLTKAFEN
jgi:hypothetical protein